MGRQSEIEYAPGSPYDKFINQLVVAIDKCPGYEDVIIHLGELSEGFNCPELTSLIVEASHLPPAAYLDLMKNLIVNMVGQSDSELDALFGEQERMLRVRRFGY